MENGKTPKYLTTDKECVIRARKGEIDALRVLYERYYADVFQYVKSKVNEIEDAKDLTSQVFTTAIEKINHLRDTDQYKNWLYTIVKNQIALYYRKQLASKIDSQEDLAFDPPDQTNDRPINFNVKCVTKRLNPNEQQVLHLRYIRDLSYAQIAEICGKTEPNVRKILERAKKKFKKLYKQKFMLSENLGGDKSESE